MGGGGLIMENIQTREKKCFTPIHCELHNKCHFAHIDYVNGYFNPSNVGEHCHTFKPRVIESDPHRSIADMLAAKAGAHE